MAKKAARHRSPRSTPLQISSARRRTQAWMKNRPQRVLLPRLPDGAPWTVMVYMAAHLDSELDAHAVRDLREMERATKNEGIRLVVQMNRNWPAQPQHYKIENNRAEQVEFKLKPKEKVGKESPTISDTGDKDSLADFMRWALQKDVAADGGDVGRRYFLVLWGHAYGLGFGRDHGDPLTLKDLSGALEAFKKRRDGRRLELLGANACALSYAEAAFELKDQVDCMVASQISVPFAGWPFETVVGAIAPGASAIDIGKLVVDRYVSTFRAAGTGEFVAMSVLNLRALDEPVFKKDFDQLTKLIIRLVDGTEAGASDRLAHMRAAMLSAGVGEVRPLIDLRDLCQRVSDVATDLAVLQPSAPGHKAIAHAAKRLADFLAPPKVNEKPSRAARRFLVACSQTGEPRGLNGVGIFVPFVTDPADLKRLGLGASERPDGARSRDSDERQTGRDTYEALKLIAKSSWNTLVYDTLRAGLPAEVVDNVGASGARTKAQRTEVTQMLVAVDSLFDVLDRRIGAVRSVATTVVPTPDILAAAKRPDPFLQLQLIRHGDVRKTAAQPRRGSKKAPAVSGKVNLAIKAFLALENTLGDVERSVRRTLTNGTYGLGPGPGGSAASLAPFGHGKGSGHGGPPRDDKGSGHGAPPLDDKGSGHGLPPDDDKGSGHGLPFASAAASFALRAIAATPDVVVAALFAEVGAALKDIEQATAEAETLVGVAVTSGGKVVNGGAPHAMQVQRAFRILADASTQARRTLRRVIADPSYGFGPGPEGVTAEDRRELARAGGLSSMELNLL